MLCLCKDKAGPRSTRQNTAWQNKLNIQVLILPWWAKNEKGEPMSSCHHFQKQISSYHTGLILTCETHYSQGKVKWWTDFQHVFLRPGSKWLKTNKHWARLYPQTVSINPRVKGSGSWWKKIWSAQSHLSSELLFTCGILGFVRAELLLSSKRGVIVLFSCECTDTYIQQGSSSNNTASHHSLSATWVSTDGTMQTSGAQLPSSRELWLSSQPVSSFPLSSSSPVSWTVILLNPDWVPLHRLRTLCQRMAPSQKQSNFQPPSPCCFFLLLSNPLPFSLVPPQILSRCLSLLLHSLLSLWGAWLVVSHACREEISDANVAQPP